MGSAIKAATVAVALAAVGGVFESGPATAQQITHGCACLHNQTQAQISYRYKWGDGEWRTTSLRPGYQIALCWQYANAQRSSPDLVFELDVDMSKGSAWTKYAIARVQTAGNSCAQVGNGGHYNVSYRPNTNNTFIHITKRN
jgi:hypothetical protein